MVKKIFFVFIPVLLLCIIVSCAPRHVEIPSFNDIDLNRHLAELSTVRSIEAVLSLEYEKGDSLMNGDASLTISENTLDLKIYYLGFLAGYISENNGVVTVSQKIDRNRTLMFVEGLKNSFLWWKIMDNTYTIEEDGRFYKLENYNRKIFLDKKTLLPAQQFIEIYNGDELRIFYDSPARIEDAGDAVLAHSPAAMWYQSGMRISLNNHHLKIKIKSYTMKTQ
jgi:hypothetical protein